MKLPWMTPLSGQIDPPKLLSKPVRDWDYSTSSLSPATDGVAALEGGVD